MRLENISVTVSSGDSVPIASIPEVADICIATCRHQRCFQLSVFPGLSSSILDAKI